MDAEVTRNALGIAGFIAPLSGADNLWSGWNIKPIHGGQGARAVLEAIKLAESGFKGCPVEGVAPRYQSLIPITCDKPNLNRIVVGLGEAYTIRDVYQKRYSGCRQTHGAADSILRIRSENGINPGQIEKVTIRTNTMAANSTGNNRTSEFSSFVECQFSIPYVAAICLLFGEASPDQYSREIIGDRMVHELAGRVEVIGDPEFDKVYPDNRPTSVEICMRGGEKYSGRVDFPTGDRRNPMKEEEIITKFEKFAIKRFDKESVGKIISFILRIEEKRDVSKMLALL